MTDSNDKKAGSVIAGAVVGAAAAAIISAGQSAKAAPTVVPPVERPPITPEVIDEKEGKLTGPGMEAVTALVVQMAQLAQQARIRKALERPQFQGKEVAVTLSATDREQTKSFLADYPYMPLATAWLINDGIRSAFIGVNGNAESFELRAGEDAHIDHQNADERIVLIFYRCNRGQTTTMRIIGKF